MRIAIKLADPKQLPVTVTLTSTIEELQALHDILPTKWPAYDLRNALYDAIHDASKVFYGESKKDEK